MPVRLDYPSLASVQLFINTVDTLKAFPFVSKNTLFTTLMAKMNPPAVSTSPRDILRLLPDINTMVVPTLAALEKTSTLPSSVHSLVVRRVDFRRLTEAGLRFADRVVEIGDCDSDHEHPADFTLFPRLAKLTLRSVPVNITLPRHKLERLTVFTPSDADEALAVFPPACAQQILLVLAGCAAFARTKAQPLPPNVRVLCSEIGEGVAPKDVFPRAPNSAITLTDRYGAEELHVFFAHQLLPSSHLALRFATKRPEWDISFLTDITSLEVSGLGRCLLSVPTNVQSLTLAGVRSVTLSGAENVTHLDVRDEGTAVAACPRLAAFSWSGTALTNTAVLPVSTETSLSAMTVVADAVTNGFIFPRALSSLKLVVREQSFDVSRLTVLTRLLALTIDARNQLPLDLSGLASVTRLDVSDMAVSRFPLSLVECRVSLFWSCDLSRYTNLTSLDLSLKVQPTDLVTFPTQLKALVLHGPGLGQTNVNEVALETLDLEDSDPITPETVEILPMTLQQISGRFCSEALRAQVELDFPLLGFEEVEAEHAGEETDRLEPCIRVVRKNKVKTGCVFV